MKNALAVLALGFGCVASAQATYVSQFVNSGQATVQPIIVAGAPPDSPAARVDPNVLTSPFSGVVSINIRYVDEATGQQLSFICSGTAITGYHVLTAGHCVDPLDNGKVIDITKPGNDVRVVVNSTTTPKIITASNVVINPDYAGFGNCPSGVNSFCVNDDLAILRLSEALPSTTATYQIYDGQVAQGSAFTMVGYGLSGNGINGYTVGPNFFIKRAGANIYDLCDTDDEANFDPNSPCEVWYYDFDGTKNGVNRDTFCLLGLACSAQLPNNVETHLGGGDSGGPSFIFDASGNPLLVANNTCGINFSYGADSTNGDFGDAGCGILLHPYLDWIRANMAPEPGSIALVGFALLLLASMSRRQLRRR